MITRWEIHEKLGDARPLNRDTTKMSAAVSETDIICTMSIQPFEIFVRARCVHDEEKFFVADAIRNQVVDDSAAFVQQKVYWPWPTFNLSMLLVSIVFSQLRESLPSTINWPMCEMSNMPTFFRTA